MLVIVIITAASDQAQGSDPQSGLLEFQHVLCSFFYLADIILRIIINTVVRCAGVAGVSIMTIIIIIICGLVSRYRAMVQFQV